MFPDEPDILRARAIFVSSLNTDDVSEYVVSGNPGRMFVGFVLPALGTGTVLALGNLAEGWAVGSGGMA